MRSIFPALFRPTGTYTSASVNAFWYASDNGYRGYRNNLPFALGNRFVRNDAEEARWQLFQSDLVP